MILTNGTLFSNVMLTNVMLYWSHIIYKYDGIDYCYMINYWLIDCCVKKMVLL